jgi:hypothetical protein
MPLMFLNGGAMSGGPLNHLLRGAPLVGVVRTAPRYRFYSVGDRFPALAEVHDPNITGPSNGDVAAVAALPGVSGVSGVAAVAAGVSVVGELYDVPWEVLRESLLPAEPAELELGVIELDDGSGVLSMIRRRTYAEPEGLYRDISEHADWRAYVASLATRTVE